MSKHFTDLYEIIQCIYQSTATRVYIVRLTGGHERFIAKEMIGATPDDFFLETNLLQELNHPAIPHLFDIFTDDSIYVMEYFTGVTFDRYLQNLEHISMETYLAFALSICEVLSYLHNRSDPILYLDFKPRNLMICDGRLCFVDFGSARHISMIGPEAKVYGTREFAAPEQILGQRLGTYTDVYGAAQMLSYMRRFLDRRDAFWFVYLIRKGTVPAYERRRISLEQMTRYLLRMQQWTRKRNKECLLKSIAVVGSDEGVGCTHIAMALVTYFNQAGFCAVYRNRTRQQVLEQVARNEKLSVNKDHFIYHEGWVGAWDVPPANLHPSHWIQVYDCGTAETPPVDATIYVCGGRIWQNAIISPWKLASPHVYIANFFTKYAAEEFAREVGEGVYVYPYQKNVFVQTREIKRLFRQILHYWNGNELFGMGVRSNGNDT